ncbi:MAG TPA: helix-turn-helix domain-containing protein [Rhabdochlamydiaceae bacterium]|jgi:predicted DNA-binding transcriptional regulator AlpA
MITISGVNYLLEKELSKKYGLSTQWFRRARYEGKCPKYHKLHGKAYYKEEEVNEWFENNMRSSQ